MDKLITVASPRGEGGAGVMSLPEIHLAPSVATPDPPENLAHNMYTMPCKSIHPLYGAMIYLLNL